MRSAMVPLMLDTLLPLVTEWVEVQQAHILRHGVPLSNHRAFDAHLAGVKNPGAVRLLKADSIPMPTPPALARANELVGLVSPLTAGITFGHGIYIRDDCWDDRPLIVHELVHVAQYEHYGSVATFLTAYLDECLTFGYPNGPLAREAIVRSTEICRT
ncbi:MAG TPA: hypothetical protein VFJ90_10895 [Candidatus Didemnitutus sp.]|nr:hypothetical protein [Candidatus Didemnitutus sp.]